MDHVSHNDSVNQCQSVLDIIQTVRTTLPTTTQNQSRRHAAFVSFDEQHLYHFAHLVYTHMTSLHHKYMEKTTRETKHITQLITSCNDFLKECTHTHMKTLCKNNNQAQYSAAVFLFNAIREHVITCTKNKHTTPYETVQCTSRMTAPGESQLRYLGGRCVAKIKYTTVARLRKHMYVKQQLYVADKRKLSLLRHLIRSERELRVTTNIPSSLEVTDHKQFISRSLINISDETFFFFKCLHDAISNLQGHGAFVQHGANILNVVKEAVIADHDLQHLFKNCFPQGQNTDAVNVLYGDCVNRYMLISNNQYRKSLVHKLRTKKTQAHRTEIQKTANITSCEKQRCAKMPKRQYMDNICNMCGAKYRKGKHLFQIT